MVHPAIFLPPGAKPFILQIGKIYSISMVVNNLENHPQLRSQHDNSTVSTMAIAYVRQKFEILLCVLQGLMMVSPLYGNSMQYGTSWLPLMHEQPMPPGGYNVTSNWASAKVSAEVV